MDPFSPIAGISLEQYADLCAEIADAPHDPDRAAQALAPRNIARADWEAARAGWTERIQDLSLSGAVAARYLSAYHAALAQRRGAPPQMSFEDYAAICGEAMASGLTVTLLRIGLQTTRWSQISHHWNTIIAREPGRFAPFMAMVEQEAARLNSGGAPRPAPKLSAPAAQPVAPPAEPMVQPAPPVAPPAPPVAPPAPPVAQPAPPMAPPPQPVAPMTPAAQAYADTPPGAIPHAQPQPQPQLQPQPHPQPQPQLHPQPQPQPYPQQPPQPQPQQGQSFEKQAGQAVSAVGSALVSGFKELGSAIDNLAKPKPNVGARVLVAWSDGNRYPGTVAQVGPGQYLVTMSDGRQHWIPEAYVTPA